MSMNTLSLTNVPQDIDFYLALSDESLAHYYLISSSTYAEEVASIPKVTLNTESTAPKNQIYLVKKSVDSPAMMFYDSTVFNGDGDTKEFMPIETLTSSDNWTIAPDTTPVI